MNILSKLFKPDATKTYLIEQNKQLVNFCDTKTPIIEKADSPIHITTMQNIDENKPNSATNIQTLLKPDNFSIGEHGCIITSAYSSVLIELLASMYGNRSLHFYLVLEQVEPLPFLQELLALSRIAIVNHHAALTRPTPSNSEIPIFISIPEFHPKTLMSDQQVFIHNIRCVFSTYPLLLQGKRKIPLYLLNKEGKLIEKSKPNEMYKCLAQSYQSPNANIYSWSRLQSHSVKLLEQNFISQVNQLEALLRYVRPKVKSKDLQPTFEQLKHQKTQISQRSGA